MARVSKMIRFLILLLFFGIVELTGNCQAGFGKASPSFSVTPSRVVLGSLPFGSMANPSIPIHIAISGLHSPFQVTNIDCSHSQGIRLLSERFDNKTLLLEMEADVKQLGFGEPFGAFIKREIRVETTDPDQPQFVVPVTGWLDVNGTQRDFNQFVFQGKERWKGRWSTPNIAGAVLTTAILVLTGILGGLVQMAGRKKGWVVASGFIIAVAILCQMLFWLGQTYSREGWIALYLSGASMALWCLPLRRPALGMLLAFSIVLLFVPQGFQRLESSARFSGDLSIANRFKLWEGAFQMMAEHPFTGVGEGKFEAVFERDYQDFAHTAKTATAVNDFLTFGAERGLFALGAAMGLLLALLVAAIRLGHQTQNILLVTLTAVLIGAVITSSFSTLLAYPDYQLVTGSAFLGVLACLIAINGMWLTSPGSAYCILLRISKATILVLTILFGLAMTSLSILPTHISAYQCYQDGKPTVSFQEISPRWKDPQGTVIYLTSTGDQPTLYHSTIRPIAAMGWRVIPLADTTNSAQIRLLIQTVRHLSPGTNLFVAGDAKGGTTAWWIAASEPSLIKAGAGFDFLSMGLASERSADAPHQPFLIYQSLYSDGFSSNPAICAQRQFAFQGLPLTVVLSRDGVDHFSAGWMKFLGTLNAFFLHENNRR